MPPKRGSKRQQPASKSTEKAPVKRTRHSKAEVPTTEETDNTQETLENKQDAEPNVEQTEPENSDLNEPKAGNKKKPRNTTKSKDKEQKVSDQNAEEQKSEEEEEEAEALPPKQGKAKVKAAPKNKSIPNGDEDSENSTTVEAIKKVEKVENVETIETVVRVEEVQMTEEAENIQKTEEIVKVETVEKSEPPQQTTKESVDISLSLGTPNQTIYLKNLNDQINLDVLRQTLYMLFSPFGHIVSIVLMKNQKMRGQGHIAFGGVLSASNAIRAMQGQNLFDKPMKIAFAKKKSDAIAKMDGTYRMGGGNNKNPGSNGSVEKMEVDDYVVKYQDSDMED